MFRIIASDDQYGAFIKKSDGEQLYYAFGPRSIWAIREEDLQLADEGDMAEQIKEGAILHDPPTEVENFEDWPAAAAAYEARVKNRNCVGATG